MFNQIGKAKEMCKPILLFLIYAVTFVQTSESHPEQQHDMSWDDQVRDDWRLHDHFRLVAYNESCSPNGKFCHPDDNLVCSSTNGTGRCICLPGYVYVRATEKCWPIQQSDEEQCHHDAQCHAGKWGPISRCSKHTSKCECYNYKTNEQKGTVLLDGVCYLEKSPGDPCQNHEECFKTMTLDMKRTSEVDAAFCQRDETGGGGSCHCKDTHTWYVPMKKCLKKATELGDRCFKTEQCRDGDLGKFSKCNETTGKCVCDGRDMSTDAVHHKKLNKCYPKKSFNESCEEDEECRASLGSDVKCSFTKEYVYEKVCHCPQNMVCKSVLEGGDGKIYAESSSVKLIMPIGITLICHFLSFV